MKVPSLLQCYYLRVDPRYRDLQLPDPNFPLARAVPSSAISVANESVTGYESSLVSVGLWITNISSFSGAVEPPLQSWHPTQLRIRDNHGL